MTEAKEPKKTKCIVCAHVMPEPPDDNMCPKCGALQGWTPCSSCYRKIAKHATHCQYCSAPQGWWRWPKFPEHIVALMTALIAVATTAINPLRDLIYHKSNTSIIFVSADPNYIYADVLNTGHSRSVVHKAWIRFGELPLADTRLRFELVDKRDTRRIIPGDSEVHLTLGVPGPARAQKPPCKSDDVTLELEVEESNGTTRLVRDVFDVHEMGQMITDRLKGMVSCTGT